MLDRIEYRIAEKLSENHLYPYGREIYINIFRHFSHFPIQMADLGVKGPGETITFLAYVVFLCLKRKNDGIIPFYRQMLKEIRPNVSACFPFNITVETFLGCILYRYHPIELRSIFSTLDVNQLFTTKEKYEYELKKNTILIHVV